MYMFIYIQSGEVSSVLTGDTHGEHVKTRWKQPPDILWWTINDCADILVVSYPKIFHSPENDFRDCCGSRGFGCLCVLRHCTSQHYWCPEGTVSTRTLLWGNHWTLCRHWRMNILPGWTDFLVTVGSRFEGDCDVRWSEHPLPHKGTRHESCSHRHTNSERYQ